jgi:hypothetical protein
MMPIIAFLLFYVFALYIITKNEKTQKAILIITLIVITYLIGSRERWPDELVYQIAFDRAPYPWDFNFSVSPFGYAEKGYLLICSIIKVFVNDSVFYLFVMGGLSMYLLYKNLTKYCAIPLLGLCDYIGRFLLNRDFQQMRSSLVILLVILGISLIKKRKLWQYMLLILVCYQFHHMTLLGVPLYFMCLLKWKRSHIIWGVVLAFIASQTLSDSISGVVDSYSEDLQYSVYTIDETNADAKGLLNPMIYFQLGILFMFLFMENELKDMSDYYYIFRTGYFYSTLFLILFCNYEALSGRTSTMFATLEMFMLPMMAKKLPKLKKYIFLAGCGVVFLYFFYSKYMSVMHMMGQDVNLQMISH